MKKLIIFLLLSWIFTANTCKRIDSENCHYAIRFSNNTAMRLRVSSVYLSVYHSDPLDIEKKISILQPYTEIKSGEQDNQSATFNRTCLEKVFKRDGYTDTVFVYIFDATIVENTSWDVIAKDYLVLKRYDLTLDDLQRLDWKITYPPTEAMKDVKQFPPYENE